MAIIWQITFIYFSLTWPSVWQCGETKEKLRQMKETPTFPDHNLFRKNICVYDYDEYFLSLRRSRVFKPSGINIYDGKCLYNSNSYHHQCQSFLLSCSVLGFASIESFFYSFSFPLISSFSLFLSIASTSLHYIPYFSPSYPSLLHFNPYCVRLFSLFLYI